MAEARPVIDVEVEPGEIRLHPDGTATVVLPNAARRRLALTRDIEYRPGDEELRARRHGETLFAGIPVSSLLTRTTLTVNLLPSDLGSVRLRRRS